MWIRKMENIKRVQLSQENSGPSTSTEAEEIVEI